MRNLPLILPDVLCFQERMSRLGPVIEFRHQAKLDAYVTRAILKALESSPHDVLRAAWAGKIAMSKLDHPSRIARV